MTAPPRVDFYILPGDAPAARDQLGCRLAEKACKMGHKVYLHTESEAHARRLDELLWTFRAGSFLPHALLGDDPQPAPPVLIGRTGGAEPPARDVLINLATAMPDFLDRFGRVAEIVDQSAEVKQAGRERFRRYRELGCQPETHKLD
ncbi:MAG: DNA polymerase III subunit chi [Gammaproteobacteria bacterium]|nr:DNA polymerase III subunit chi [Gammaproteobacteria bacterium]